MIVEDIGYFGARARQSRVARDAAQTSGARRIHADLVARYQRMADVRASTGCRDDTAMRVNGDRV